MTIREKIKNEKTDAESIYGEVVGWIESIVNVFATKSLTDRITNDDRKVISDILVNAKFDSKAMKRLGNHFDKNADFIADHFEAVRARLQEPGIGNYNYVRGLVSGTLIKPIMKQIAAVAPTAAVRLEDLAQ